MNRKQGILFGISFAVIMFYSIKDGNAQTVLGNSKATTVMIKDEILARKKGQETLEVECKKEFVFARRNVAAYQSQKISRDSAQKVVNAYMQSESDFNLKSDTINLLIDQLEQLMFEYNIKNNYLFYLINEAIEKIPPKKMKKANRIVERGVVQVNQARSVEECNELLAQILADIKKRYKKIFSSKSMKIEYS